MARTCEYMDFDRLNKLCDKLNRALRAQEIVENRHLILAVDRDKEGKKIPFTVVPYLIKSPTWKTAIVEDYTNECKDLKNQIRALFEGEYATDYNDILATHNVADYMSED